MKKLPEALASESWRVSKKEGILAVVTGVFRSSSWTKEPLSITTESSNSSSPFSRELRVQHFSERAEARGSMLIIMMGGSFLTREVEGKGSGVLLWASGSTLSGALGALEVNLSKAVEQQDFFFFYIQIIPCEIMFGRLLMFDYNFKNTLSLISEL